MAASDRGLPLSPPLASPRASTRHLAPSPRRLRSPRGGCGGGGGGGFSSAAGARRRRRGPEGRGHRLLLGLPHPLLHPDSLLVASAVQDAGQIAELELLSAVKSADKLAASIFLKPFCFEGQRRQIEASNLIAKLQTFSNFHIVIEAAPQLLKLIRFLRQKWRLLLKHWKGFNQMF